jgi:hypothetical protein
MEFNEWPSRRFQRKACSGRTGDLVTLAATRSSRWAERIDSDSIRFDTWLPR